MQNFLLIGIPLFLVITIIVWKLTMAYHRKLISEREEKLRGSRIYYWEFVIMISSAVTLIIVYLLKLSNLINL